MTKLLILEGPDGGGKTTFARSVRVHETIVDHGPYPNHGPGELAPVYWPMIADALRGQPRTGDRSWLAEPVYGAAFRGGANRIPVAQRRMLERGALAAGAIVLLFLPGLDHCVRTFNRRREIEYLETPAELVAVYDGYLGYLRGGPTGLTTDLPVMIVDFHAPISQQDWLYAIDAVNAPVNPYGGGVLDHGRVLIVGDRPGAPTDHHVPFVSWSRSGCSAWLADQLEADGVRERDLCWVNAYTFDGEPNAAFEAVLGEGVEWAGIIALGGAAAQALKTVGVESFDAIPHPQHHKRFRYGEPYALGRTVQRFLSLYRQETR